MIKIVEVGPRDGLQNEKTLVPTSIKVDLVNRLTTTGITHIEATSFVSARSVPQLADAVEVMRHVKRRPATMYSALVPNIKGLEDAFGHHFPERIKEQFFPHEGHAAADDNPARTQQRDHVADGVG